MAFSSCLEGGDEEFLDVLAGSGGEGDMSSASGDTGCFLRYPKVGW